MEPSPNQRPYNPANDGLPAKVWECLRRNREFKERFSSVKSIAEGEQRHEELLSAQHDAELTANLAAEFVFGELERFDLGKTWPELPEDLRERYAQLFATTTAHDPYDPRDAFKGRGTMPYVLDPAHLPPDAPYPEGHVLIAVPAYIRDSGHRKAVIKSLDQLVNQPATDLREVHFKPGGKVLGTSRAWADYLVDELLKYHIPAPLRRRGICERVNSRTEPDEGSIQIAEYFRFSDLPKDTREEIDDLGTRRGATVKDRIKDMERIIAGIYPEFDLLTATSTG